MKLRPLTAKSGGLTIAAVAALALGIGLTALMFAILDGTIRRGLPAPEAARIVHLERVPGVTGEQRRAFTLPEFERLQASGALQRLAAYSVATPGVTGAGTTPRRWDAAYVSRSTFEILGALPAHGSVWPADAAAAGVRPALISDVMWREQFASDPAIVGRAIAIDGRPAAVAGVMPPGFGFPFSHHLWMPADALPREAIVSVWGRLGPASGDASASALTAAYAGGATPAAADARVIVRPYTAQLLGPDVLQSLNAMFLAGLGVLVIACANVANLLLAQGLARRRDFAIATALGASRIRVMRDRLGEALVLAIPGAIAGVLIAYAGVRIFNAAIAATTAPYWVRIAVDGRVLAYVLVVTVATALAASVLPAWRSSRARVSADLAIESRGVTSTRFKAITAALVVVEVALSAAVLVCAGLMGAGVMRLAATTYSFDLADVTVARASLPPLAYAAPDARRTFYMALQERLDAAGIGSAVAMGNTVPFVGAATVAFSMAGEPERATWPPVRLVSVSPGYFSALGVSSIGGRDFERADMAGRTRVAVVNLSFTLKYARRQDPLGRTIRVRPLAGGREVEATIVGVVPDLAVGGARGEQPEAIYFPLFQQTTPPMAISIVARSDRPQPAIEQAVQKAVWSIDPSVPVDRVMPLSALRAQSTWFYRVFGFLFLTFGVGALALALVGVYAVMSFSVTRRRREIGTRMAFGATSRQIAWMFFREGSGRLAAGSAIGLVLAAVFAPRLGILLYRVDAHEAGIYTAAVGIVMAVGLSALLGPAMRAARQDPNQVLRDE